MNTQLAADLAKIEGRYVAVTTRMVRVEITTAHRSKRVTAVTDTLEACGWKPGYYEGIFCWVKPEASAFEIERDLADELFVVRQREAYLKLKAEREKRAHDKYLGPRIKDLSLERATRRMALTRIASGVSVGIWWTP